MANFIENLRSQLLKESNYSTTENGALGYGSTGKCLLDLNFMVSSLRNADATRINSLFSAAYDENPVMATIWLFFLRDVRGGMGERRAFRTIIHWMADNHPEMVYTVLNAKTDDGQYLIPFYGRWDDMLILFKHPIFRNRVGKIIAKQLRNDMRNMAEGKSVSLLAKWLPSIAGSNDATARLLCRVMHIRNTEYRHMLTKLRAYIDVVEVKMSSRQWGQISYEKVPSKANIMYGDAFMRHDTNRRAQFISDVAAGKTKVNAGVLFPHDVIMKVRTASTCNSDKIDELDGIWKALPNFCEDGKEPRIMVVADGSGSMRSRASRGSSATKMDVAMALAIYFAERLPAEFRDTYITFSENPQLVHLGGCKNIVEKYDHACNFNEIANTNIQRVFELILKTAVGNNMRQDELPETILVLSDMEFDECAESNTGSINKRLFDVISERYAAHGYKLPKLAFWNIGSTTGTIPVVQNDLGVSLISGFSPNTMKMVMSNNTDPYRALLDVLLSDRYAPVIRQLAG